MMELLKIKQQNMEMMSHLALMFCHPKIPGRVNHNHTERLKVIVPREV
jgi:hypothetical protein